MSYSELLASIENLRLRMHNLIDDGFTYSEVLKVSQELDKLIVEYHRCIPCQVAGMKEDSSPVTLEKNVTGDVYFST